MLVALAFQVLRQNSGLVWRHHLQRLRADDHCLSLFRYLLQIMMEANCLEIASLISVLLKDALALIRIVNAARSTPGDAGDKSVVTRLYQNLKALEAWAQSEW